MDGWLRSAAWEERARQDLTLIKNQNLFLIFLQHYFHTVTSKHVKCFVTTDKLIKGSMHKVYTPSHLNPVTIFENENVTLFALSYISSVDVKHFHI